jgi:hypothetical protein
MQTDPLVAIHAELAQIKLVLLIVGSLVATLTVLAIVSRLFRLRGEYRSFLYDQFSRDASELFDTNKLVELKTLCRSTLAHQPNHVQARWHLGRTLILEGDLDAATREFEALRRVCPTWDADYIAPYVQEMARLRAMQSSAG